MRQHFFKFAIVIAGLFLFNPVKAKDKSATVYLIRHAEKQKGSDPSLTKLGMQRAKFYREHWQDLSITHIFSTNYKRTQETVALLAKHKNIGITSYDPKDMPSFATHIKQLSGHIIVSGHSNTTPQLAGLLGTEFSAMSETEFDRIYQITLLNGKVVDWAVLRSFP